MSSSAAATAIQHTDLQPHRTEPLNLDDGGTAELTQADYRGRPYLFKRYHDEYRDKASSIELTRMLRWRESRSVTDQRTLAAIAAWPRYTVWDGDRLLGLLIPPAPATFLVGRRPRSLEMLLQPGDGRPGDRRDALAIKLNAFGHLIEAVTWFHDRGVVVNDLHAHNVLVSRFGDAVHLVDCDSMTGLHWNQVLPRNLAPDGMREVIPEVDRPSVATDFARLSQVIVSTLLDEEVVQIGEKSVAVLTDMLSEPVATFLCAARLVPNFTADAAEHWRRLGGRWRAGSTWAAADAADISAPQPSWTPVGGPLLPDGFTFPRLDVSVLRLGLDLSGPDEAPPPRRAIEADRATVVVAATWQPPPGRRRSLTLVLVLAVLLLASVAAGLGLP
jgi:hypothetical protein